MLRAGLLPARLARGQQWSRSPKIESESISYTHGKYPLAISQYCSSAVTDAEKRVPNKLHKDRIELIARNLGIKKPEDWYSYTVRQVENAGAGNLLSHYGRSLHAALHQIYPQHDWKPWLFRKLPKEWASNVQNQRLYLDWAAQELGFSNLDGWYSVSREQFTKRFGRGIVGNFYRDSIRKMLLTVYPEHSWDPKLFARLSATRTSWADPGLRRKVFETAMEKLDIPTVEALATARVADFVKATGAASLIYRRYKGSLLLALQDTYPDKSFPTSIESQQRKAPRPYTRRDSAEESKLFSLQSDTDKQRLWLETFMKDRNIKSLRDLVEISSKEFKSFSAESASLVRRYGSVRSMISTLYGEDKMETTESVDKKRKMSKQALGVRQFMQSASAALRLSSLDGWYAVAASQLISIPRGKKILSLYNNDIVEILKDAFPEHLWDEWRFITAKGRRVRNDPS